MAQLAEKDSKVRKLRVMYVINLLILLNYYPYEERLIIRLLVA